ERGEHLVAHGIVAHGERRHVAHGAEGGGARRRGPRRRRAAASATRASGSLRCPAGGRHRGSPPAPPPAPGRASHTMGVGRRLERAGTAPRPQGLKSRPGDGGPAVPRFTREVLVHAPPSRVWRLLIEPAERARWLTSMREEPSEGGPLTLGTRIPGRR